MKATTAQKTRIGIFTLIGILLLVLGIFIIGSKKNMFSDTFSIYGTYKNVGGLQVGNNVRFAGINVGTIESINIINDSTVRVNMRMQSKVHQFLKNDAIAAIGSDGLMGDKIVIISPGATGDKIIANDGQIMTSNPVDFDKILTRITHVAENAEIITASLASIANQISSGQGSIGKLIYTDELSKGLESTVTAARTTMQSAQKGSEGFAENMEALKHNFLLKKYYKKKAKQEEAKEKRENSDEPDEKSSKEQKKEKKANSKLERAGPPAVAPK